LGAAGGRLAQSSGYCYSNKKGIQRPAEPRHAIRNGHALDSQRVADRKASLTKIFVTGDGKRLGGPGGRFVFCRRPQRRFDRPLPIPDYTEPDCQNEQGIESARRAVTNSHKYQFKQIVNTSYGISDHGRYAGNRLHLTLYPRPSRHAARALAKAPCCCCDAACCCCCPCWAVAAFCRRLCARPAAAPAAAPVRASSPTTSPTTAPRAAPRTPAPGVVPVAVVGGLAAGCCGGGFAGSKPVCWTAHE